MNSNDLRWRRSPLLCAVFAQWRKARATAPAGKFRLPFRRDWWALLESANLDSDEPRREAEQDARALVAANLVELQCVKDRPYQIKQIIVPFEAEPHLRRIFADQLPQLPDAKFDPASVNWEPELQFLRTARLGVAPDDLLKLNAFFANGGRAQPLVPIKERSLEIFGDEKRIDALQSTSLADSQRLPLAILRCFRVSEPLGWKRGPRPDRPVIAIENACTWESYCRWNDRHGLFSAVVYGCGNRFADGIARLGDIFSELGGPRDLFYFGDLDPQGLRIPQLASRYGQSYGLPPVQPHLWSYRQLLELGAGKESALGEVEALELEDFAWLGELSGPVQQLFANGHRLAQEHVGWRFLSSSVPAE